jgi:diacylglycerol kinase
MAHWVNKFANALRGIGFGMAGQSSFLVHVSVAVLVLIVAFVLQCTLWQWCLLTVCISQVLCLELMNSALESLAKGLCHEQNLHVGRALDIASGAVLLASILSAIVGATIFMFQFQLFLSAR